MNLLTLPFRLPFLPISGVVSLGQIIYDQAELQQHGPAAVRRQLEEAEQARRSGQMSDRALAEAQAQAVGRVVKPRRPEQR